VVVPVGYVSPMTQEAILHMRVSAEFEAQLAALRKAESDLPSKSEMIRRLVERANAALAAPSVAQPARPDNVVKMSK